MEFYIVYGNKTQLNLALCDKYPINLLIPLELNDEMKQQYEQLKKSGYNILDINDDFYQDICISFDSSEGTDMIISDRVNYINNNDNIKCQSNCKFSK